MIKRLIIIFFFSFCLLSKPSFSVELTVNIEKVKEFDKKIMIELFLLTETASQGWENLNLLDKQVVELNFENKTANQGIIYAQLESGKYSLRVFQDINNNGVLDKSPSNIPLEPVGFSGNPSLFGGEPSPQDSAIELISDKVIVINLKHRKPRKNRAMRH